MSIRGLRYNTILFALLCTLTVGASLADAKECIDCHSGILKQFSANSHHVQGIGITGRHCYTCHWEATADGQINAQYHKGAAEKKSVKSVNLVVWKNGERPGVYKADDTSVVFRPSALGTSAEREEVAKVTTHCLGCHSDAANSVRTFAGDTHSPLTYAWDGQSVASRYSQKGVARWGKYSTAGTNKKQQVVKALSAHGNAAANQGGWSPASGYDGAIPDTRSGAKNVECFDCHNSHGSNVSGVTSSYRSSDGTFNGALLKETSAGNSGYRMNYKPSANSYAKSNNPFNAGAGLCFDCHENATAGATPWGYGSTFGAQQPIMGYKDSPGFGAGSKGSTARFANRQSREEIVSSHLKAGKPLSHQAQGQINGLCTPCHDPHGVSRTLGEKMPYAVPLLKGTWLTSPYREDGPPSAKGDVGKQVANPSGSNERSDYNAVNREAGANFGKGESGAARSDYNAVNREAGSNFGKGDSSAARPADYNAVNREAGANFGKGTSGAARESDYNKVNREAGANFGKGESGAARSDYNAVNREAGSNFGKGESSAARPADYNAVNREAGANFGKGTSGAAQQSDFNSTNRSVGANFGKGVSAAAREKDANTSNRDSGSNFAKGGSGAPREPMKGMKYNVDQNTFDGNSRIKENDEAFAGLCLKCHSRAGLTGESKTGMVHRTVKGWGNNKEHSFPCSKCHQSHNSGLPRLMQTNCFEQGPAGLRESSGVPWLPYKKGESTAQVLDSSKASSQSKVVGCHVKQFGKATAATPKGHENGQWKEVTSW